MLYHGFIWDLKKKGVNNMEYNDQREEEKNKNRKKIVFLIAIIIILLSLITSCSCTSNFWGKIGNLFQNEGNHPIDSDPSNQEVVRNKELKFDMSELEISLSDSKTKLTYSYKRINPKEFMCVTSDASIATCYVADGYVVVNPKKEGKVTVTLQTSTNGKTYEATTVVTIGPATKYIHLETTTGTINLAYGNQLNIPYSLIGLTGDVSVALSDESIAKAVANNGILTITALKKGNTDITLSLSYNGEMYKVVYKLSVMNDRTSNVGKPGAPSIVDPGNNNPGTGVNPPVEEPKESNSRLKKLDLSWISFPFDPNQLEYRIGVSSWRRTVKLTAETQSNRAKIISYTFNGQEVSKNDINKLKLKTGENVITVTVEAEDKTTSTYKVIVDKAKSSNNYLKSLTITSNEGTLSPKFDKNQLSYEIEVESNVSAISLEAIARSKKATLSYTFNGITTNSLTNLNLRTGPNTVRITVTASDGSKRTYKVIINRKSKEDVLDTNSYLKELTDSLGKIDFDPDQMHYTFSVDKTVDDISLTAKPSSNKANVEYVFNNNVIDDLSNLALMPGDNTVKIIVTAEDGITKKEYTVVINKELEDDSNILLDGKVIGNKAEMNPPFDSNTLFYQINVEDDVTNLGLDFTMSSTTEGVNFTYRGQPSTREEFKNLPLEYGDNVATVTVIGTNNITRTYTFVINRKSPKSNDTSLKDLKVDGESILDSYSKTFDFGTTSTILMATPTDKNATVTYYYKGVEYKDLKELEVTLEPGENFVDVKVTAEDGFTSRVYQVALYKVERKIKFTTTSDTCYIEDKNCIITYTINDIDPKTGAVINNVTNSMKDHTIVSVLPNNITVEVIEPGKVKLVPNNTVSSGQTATLSVSLDNLANSNVEKTITFLSHDYTITSTKYQYDMSYTNTEGGSRAISLKTDILTGNISKVETDSQITLCSIENPNNCIYITKEGPIDISYKGELSGPTSLPIVVKATGTGTAYLHVTGTAYGKTVTLPQEVTDSKIQINIAPSYLVKIKAYDGSFDTPDKTYKGFFNTLTTEYEFVLAGEESIDLLKYDEPYLVIDGGCWYHEFIGYAKETDPNKTILYDRTTNTIIRHSDLTMDTTFVAIYNMENQEQLVTKDEVMWLSDVPLFANEKAKELYNDEKMIYPGANGKYTMNITNQTDDQIIITGLILKEETICIDGVGCLNMGYIIKDHANNYHFGASNDYWILNQKGMLEDTEVYKNDFDFDSSTQTDMTIDKGETVKITIHWKWVDYQDGHTDRLDTLIGNKALELGQNDLLYRLAVGIKYQTVNKQCK